MNDAPAGTSKTVTAIEDTAFTFAASDFGFSDVDGHALAAVKITTLPGGGGLANDGVPVSAGDTIAVADIDGGELKFTPAANANGAAYSDFTFQVQDDGGTANGGVDLDQSANTITVNVTAVNDAPAGADKTVTAIEDTGLHLRGRRFRLHRCRRWGRFGRRHIFDLDAGKMISLDHKKKEAIVLDTAALTDTLQKVDKTDVKASLTPTSEKKQVAGYDCTVHNSEVQMAFSPAEGMNLQIVMTGPVCLSQTAPGKAEYATFYNAAVEKGFFFTDPRAAKASPGPAKAFAELYRKWADAGVPLSSNITLKFEGGGFMTGMMNKMAGGPMTSETTNVDTAAIADTEFTAPADYKVKKP